MHESCPGTCYIGNANRGVWSVYRANLPSRFSVTIFSTLKSEGNSVSGWFRNVIKESENEHLLILTLDCKQGNYIIIHFPPNKKCSVSELSYADRPPLLNTENMYMSVLRICHLDYVASLTRAQVGLRNLISFSIINKAFEWQQGSWCSHAQVCSFVCVSVSKYKENHCHGMKLKSTVNALPEQFWGTERRMANHLLPPPLANPWHKQTNKICSHSFLVLTVPPMKWGCLYPVILTECHANDI